MAKTREYMDYLDEHIGIAPANSQEELQAAQAQALAANNTNEEEPDNDPGEQDQAEE